MKPLVDVMTFPRFHLFVAVMAVLCLHGRVAAEPQVVTIEDAVVRALSVHPELRAEAHRREATEADAAAARTRLLPTASASGNYTHTGKLQSMSFGGRTFEVGAEDAVTVTGRLDQVLFTGGQLTAQIGQAEATDRAELSRLESVRQSVILRTREACYDVIRAEALLASAADATASAGAHRRDADARVRSGLAAGVELTRADVRVAEASLNEVSLRNRRDLATSRLAVLLGLPTTADLAVSGELPLEPLQRELENDESTALSMRPDLRAVRGGIRVNELGVDAARAGYWPSVSAFGAWTWQDDETRQGDESWNVGVAGSWTLFDWGRTARTVDAASARARAAQADAEAYEDRVRIEVREARLSVATARESIRLAQARVAASTEDLRISRVRFQGGVGAGTEVIDAERDLASAEAGFINARADLAVAHARHWYATGGTSPR